MFNTMPETILTFYQGDSTDSEGRMIETIWSWNYQKLEYIHNYIQWLFPLKERSRFNQNAPVLNEEVIQAFRTSNELKKRLKKSLEVMLRFYGLECNNLDDTDIQITKSPDYPERKLNWIEEGNHNYLRITRILTSLKLLGLENYAQALLNCLQQIYLEEGENIGTETYAYWISVIDD
ncbi:MAG TPA: hypothetical protein DD379_14860 [Cyanobacteria bacterium UBA11162]|nr:hypothetical protein [Cyanobacteria bacterium UBA11162]